MNFRKHILADISKCYAVLGQIINGEPHLFFAGEGNGSVHVFHGEDFSQHQILTEGGGGTMSIVPIPEKDGWILISRGFYSMVESQDSVIELIRYDNGVFSDPKRLVALPYLHRFGLIKAPDNTTYLVAASIADYKKDKDDWSCPGHLYYAVLPENFDESAELNLTRLPGDYYINHGFYVHKETVYIGCRDGVFQISPPETADGGCFLINRLLDFPASDIALCDIDRDGEDELAVLLPFHGDQFKIYKRIEGTYREVYHYPIENDFYHAVSGATICKEPAFVVGARQLASQLLLVRWDEKARDFVNWVIEDGVGPSNAAVFNLPSSDILLSANRKIDQATIYIFDRAQN